jgi:hypothetical protein
MAYTSSAIDAREMAFTAAGATTQAPSKAKARPQRGLFGRMLDAMMAARMRQAEREVARYLADTGGKFTDEAEREIERRFLSTPSRW